MQRGLLHPLYVALISVFCLAVPQKVSASGASCEVWLSPFKLSTVYYSPGLRYIPGKGDKFVLYHIHVHTHRPQNGPGHLLTMKIPEGDANYTSLYETAFAFPKFFAQFDIVADADRTLTIPDAERLNSFMKNNVQFKDVSVLSRQGYSDEYFDRSLEAGKIPLASLGFYFLHDRLQEHMMGALIMPPWLYEKYVQYSRFEKALFESDFWNAAFKEKEQKLKYEQGYRENRSSPGKNWDNMTASLGLKLTLMVRPDTTRDQVIDYLKSYLLYVSRALTPSHEDSYFNVYLRTNSVPAYFPHFAYNKDFMKKLRVLEQQFLSETISEDFAKEEATRIVNEVMQ